jgi:hypothetical protein
MCEINGIKILVTILSELNITLIDNKKIATDSQIFLIKKYITDCIRKI